MQLRITRLDSDDERKYSIMTGSGTRYGVQAPELRRWLINLGVADSTVDDILKIEPNETTTLQVAKAA